MGFEGVNILGLLLVCRRWMVILVMGLEIHRLSRQCILQESIFSFHCQYFHIISGLTFSFAYDRKGRETVLGLATIARRLFPYFLEVNHHCSGHCWSEHD